MPPNNANGRNLVFCADGTWNSKDNPARRTNVSLLWEMCVGGSGEQIKKYQKGVGTTGSILSRLAGGAFGKGLDENIIAGYAWLAKHYQPNDRIYLFGFSRGAYTVRSLVGMINSAGLLDLSSDSLSNARRRDLSEDVFSIYRERGADLAASQEFQRHPLPDIHFMGCWDTVGALGIPDEVNIIRKLSRPVRYHFNDTKLSNNVLTSRHAVSIDEIRRSYAPTLWEETAANRDMKQVWFTGVHANVGGGYRNRQLSDIALDWMVEEAKTAGLLIRSDHSVASNPVPQGKLENSHKGFFGKLKSRPRSVPNFRSPERDQLFSAGALARHEANLGYWPTTVLQPGETTQVSVNSNLQWVRTNVFLEAGASYRLIADGKWFDAGVPHGPMGAKESVRQLGHRIGDFWARFERDATDNAHEPSTLSPARRFAGAQWFSLVGVIANGKGVDQVLQNIVAHQTFLIGEEKELTVQKGGYLYCYANDAWKFYWNNKGSLKLRIARTS